MAQHRCEFVIPRKMRRCRMLTKTGNRFCGEHLTQDPTNKLRIPCPNDPKHTVASSELSEHLKRCNARLPAEVFIRQNVNRTSEASTDVEFIRPNDDQITEMMQIIGKLFAENPIKLLELEESNEPVGEELPDVEMEADHEDPSINPQAETKSSNEKKKSQLVQLDSILRHLSASSLLSNSEESCLVDLGSGRAQLIYWMAKRVPKCRFLLVDRMGARNKFDRKALHENSKLQIHRIRCSIEHLDLSKVPVISECKASVTAVCKHFCGVATDYGIRCLLGAQSNGVHLNGFTLAACCHHRCVYEEFVGNEFLRSVGIETAEQFAALRHISTWATCGTYEADQPRANAEKLEMGRRAKRIFEWSRCEFLRKELGTEFDIGLYKYVDYGISPENLLIVGKRRKVE